LETKVRAEPFRRSARISLFLALGTVAGCCTFLERAVKGPQQSNREKAEVSAAIAAGCPTPRKLGMNDIFNSAVDSTSVDTEARRAAGEVHDAAANYRDAIVNVVDNIKPEEERAVGQATALNVISQRGGLLLDQPLVDYVNEVANLVAQQGARLPAHKTGAPRTLARRFFVGVVANPDPNAWSAPGGYIVVTSGLMRILSSESELAFVLGHEIAHIDNEDGLTALKISLRARAIGRGVIDPASARNISLSDSGVFAHVVDAMADVMLAKGLGKTAEERADRTGVGYAFAAGYDAQGADRVFATLDAAGLKGASFSNYDSPKARRARIADLLESHSGGRIGAERYEAAILRLETASLAAH
jgi:predicted Zn-dependent protease